LGVKNWKADVWYLAETFPSSANGEMLKLPQNQS
jgi:hypothetical protein